MNGGNDRSIIEFLGSARRPDRQEFLTRLASDHRGKKVTVLLWLFDTEEKCLFLDRVHQTEEPDEGVPPKIAGARRFQGDTFGQPAFVRLIERASDEVNRWLDEKALSKVADYELVDPADGSPIGLIEIYASPPSAGGAGARVEDLAEIHSLIGALTRLVISSRETKVLKLIKSVNRLDQLPEEGRPPEEEIFSNVCESLVEAVGCELAFVAKIDFENTEWKVVSGWSKDRGSCRSDFDSRPLGVGTLVDCVGKMEPPKGPIRLVNIENIAEVKAVFEKDEVVPDLHFLQMIKGARLIRPVDDYPCNWMGTPIVDDGDSVCYVIVLHNKRKRYCKYFSHTDGECAVAAAKLCSRMLQLGREAEGFSSILNLDFPGEIHNRSTTSGLYDALKGIIPRMSYLAFGPAPEKESEGGDARHQSAGSETIRIGGSQLPSLRSTGAEFPVRFQSEEFGKLTIEVASGKALTKREKASVKVFCRRMAEAFAAWRRAKKPTELFVDRVSGLQDLILGAKVASKDEGLDLGLERILREVLQKGGISGVVNHLSDGRGRFFLGSTEWLRASQHEIEAQVRQQISANGKLQDGTIELDGGALDLRTFQVVGDTCGLLIEPKNRISKEREESEYPIAAQVVVEGFRIRDRFYSGFPRELSEFYWSKPDGVPWPWHAKDNKDPANTVTLSYDLRKSTHSMSLAGPGIYNDWLMPLIDDLKQCCLENGGIFDKFTGDGVLVHFVEEICASKEAVECAIKLAFVCADRMMEATREHMKDLRKRLHYVHRGIGAGIGIDYGPAYWRLDKRGNPVITGEAVVGACRLCDGSPAGHLRISNSALWEWDRRNEEYGSLNSLPRFEDVLLESKEVNKEDQMYVWQRELTGRNKMQLRPPIDP